jgi:hypothetical protein
MYIYIYIYIYICIYIYIYVYVYMYIYIYISAAAGTQFTCFTSTKYQKNWLTQQQGWKRPLQGEKKKSPVYILKLSKVTALGLAAPAAGKASVLSKEETGAWTVSDIELEEKKIAVLKMKNGATRAGEEAAASAEAEGEAEGEQLSERERAERERERERARQQKAAEAHTAAAASSALQADTALLSADSSARPQDSSSRTSALGTKAQRKAAAAAAAAGASALQADAALSPTKCERTEESERGHETSAQRARGPQVLKKRKKRNERARGPQVAKKKSKKKRARSEREALRYVGVLIVIRGIYVSSDTSSLRPHTLVP